MVNATTRAFFCISHKIWQSSLQQSESLCVNEGECHMPFKVEMVESENDKNREELWKFYEKAIEGRDSFYKHYIKYMHLYAIFTGALFVAFYNLIKPISDNESKLYAILVACLGLVTSILWLCSVKGYYSWIISWINVVKYYEERLNSSASVHKACFVYSLYYKHTKDSCYLTKPSSFSTQKLTMIFVELVITGWIFSIILLFTSKQLLTECCALFSTHPYIFISTICFVSVILFALAKCIREKLKDDVDTHYILDHSGKICEEKVKENFSVTPPQKW